MSLVTLQSPPRIQAQRSSANAEAKEASFLTFDYVNKHARVRVSPTPLDLSSFEGKGDFLAVANSKGWFAAITRSSNGQIQLSCSPLSHLHALFATSPGAGVDEIKFTPQRSLTISPATPNILTIACNDTRLLIGSTQGPIAMYDCSQLFTEGTNEIVPMHTFSGTRPCEQIAPNPGDIPELVAVLRQGDSSTNSIELLNLQTLQTTGGWNSGGTPETTPSSLSWSPRGKQIAIGLQNGDIVTFSPGSTDSPKSVIPKPSTAGDCRVLSITWLANPTFHAVYAPLGPITPKMPQNHYVVNFDSKSSSVSEVSLSTPYYPFPGLRPPGPFVLALRNWNPVKFLLFVGDGTSSEIGSIGCFAESNRESWCNLSLDEAFTPSLPLDKNLDETVLLGLQVDLTSTDVYDHVSVSGEKVEVSPPPIVYAYCSDGTILAWHVVNASGTPYPGMINHPASSSMSDSLMSMTPSTSTNAETKTSPGSTLDAAQGATSAFGTFGQTAKQQSFGQSGFGFNQPAKFGSSQPTSSGFSAFSQTGGQATFGQPSFGVSSSGQPSFGQTAFGQPTQASAFGQPLAFGQSGFGGSPFGQPASFGFASYATPIPPAFGQTNSTFTSSGSSTTQAQSNAELPELTREISMGIEAPESDLGGLSLGTAPTESEKPIGKGTMGLFGQPSSQPTSVLGSGAFGSGNISPGFGAFSSWGQRKDTSVPMSTAPSETKFSPSPAFGQSSFGQGPAFGKTSFGSTPMVTPGSGSTSGGFSAYSNSFASLAGTPPSGAPTKPVWVTAKSEAPLLSESQRQAFSSQDSSSISTPAKGPLGPAKDTSPTTIEPVSSSTSKGSDAVVQTFSVLETGKAAGTSTPFKAGSPPVVEGAFSNLKQSPIGLGAFGRPDQNSPFFKADKPVSSFPTSATETKPVPAVGSVFGSPSRLGISPPTVFTASPTVDGFLTFSGSSGELGRLTTKSFSDLKERAKSEEESTRQSTSVFSLPTSGQREEVLTPQKRDSEEQVKVTSVFAKLPPKSLQPLPPNTGNYEEGLRESSEDEVGSKTSEEELDEEQVEDHFASDTGSESDVDEFLSYEDINSRLEEEPDVEGPHELSPVAEETSLHDESFDEGVTSVQETIIKAESPDPVKVPLPPSRSPSAVPSELSLFPALEAKFKSSSTPPLDSADFKLPSSPSTSISRSPNDTSVPKLPSPTPTIEHQAEQVSFSQDSESTTPPSSPAKLSPILPSPTPAMPFGIGSGRTSMRPARSSPLARAPILGEIGDDEDVAAPSPLPSLLKPRPASPKPTFGQWGTSPASALEGSEDKKLPRSRSRTPPLSVLSLPTPSLSSNVFSTASKTQTNPSLSSSDSTPSKSFFAPPVPLLQSEASAPPRPFAFDRPVTQKTTVIPTTPPVPSGRLFFGNRTLHTPSPPATVTSVKSATTPIAEPSAQEGMQAECVYLFTNMNKELEELKLLAGLAIRKQEHFMKPSPTPVTKSDLGDPNKWSMADINDHGKAMKKLQAEFSAVKATREQFLKSIQEIESDMLKATTRNEEIVRFNKAISNPEFAKMLKLRTLGPEYLETQAKLRKQMRTMRDRVEKLEGHLHTSKKMLSRQKSGKVGFRPPSLDTINRTYRNIDIAIFQQNEDITKLAARAAKLDPQSFGRLPSRDKRLPDKTSRRFNVTPSVAATTAAALNGERSAYKLKQVLLSVRDKPLLNDTAARSMPSRVDFKTPQKATNTGWGSSTWQIPSSPTPTPAATPLAGNAESPPSTGGTRRGAGSKYHLKSVFPKKPVFTPADQQASPTPAAPASSRTGFDWGPLPMHNTKPVPTLPFSLK